MFHNRKFNSHKNLIYERALRIIYQQHNSMFQELFAKDGSFKIHDHKKKLAPEIMNEVFETIESPYPLRNELRFK